MSDRISMDDVMKISETNPEAASLALGMQLMADSSVERSRIYDSLIESKDRQIEKLEAEIAFLRPLASRWCTLKEMLKEPGERLS